MGATAQEIRVEYDYITAHSHFWADNVATELATMMKVTRDMNLRCRNTYFFGQFMKVHDAMVTFVQERADEGHQTAFDIAETLAEIKAYYEADQQFNAWLLQTGGHRP